MIETGQKYNRLTAIAPAPRRAGLIYWVFGCDCGTTKEIYAAHVMRGNTKSCGCLNSEKARARKLRHGLTGSLVHSKWIGMLERCRNPNVDRFARYGGRGIKVCDRWHTFENFYADMGLPPSSAHQIDRIDNDGNYEPGNCRWATAKEQARNRRTSRTFWFNGRRVTLAELSELTGLNYGTLKSRLVRLRWSVVRAVTTPPLERGNRLSNHSRKHGTGGPGFLGGQTGSAR